MIPIVVKTIIQETLQLSMERGIDLIDKKLDLLVRKMKKDKEIQKCQMRKK